MTPLTPELLNQVRGRLQLRYYSLRTEQAYVGWIRRFILENGKRNPGQIRRVEVEAFLTELATQGQVSVGTQHQALAALPFLYREVLGAELPWMEKLQRAKRARPIPVVLSAEDVARTMQELLDHKAVVTTQIYTHVLGRGASAVRSPLDGLRTGSG
ncbi:UNVERIFIED_ORG: site-specific recombinase XerD [Xanthomonas campestris]